MDYQSSCLDENDNDDRLKRYNNHALKARQLQVLLFLPKLLWTFVSKIGLNLGKLATAAGGTAASATAAGDAVKKAGTMVSQGTQPVKQAETTLEKTAPGGFWGTQLGANVIAAFTATTTLSAGLGTFVLFLIKYERVDKPEAKEAARQDALRQLETICPNGAVHPHVLKAIKAQEDNEKEIEEEHPHHWWQRIWDLLSSLPKRIAEWFSNLKKGSVAAIELMVGAADKSNATIGISPDDEVDRTGYARSRGKAVPQLTMFCSNIKDKIAELH